MLPGHGTVGAGGEGARPGAWEPAGPLALTISSAEGGRGAAPSAAGKAHTRPHPLPLSAHGARRALCQGRPAVALPRHPSNRTRHRRLQKMVPTTLGLPVFLT